MRYFLPILALFSFLPTAYADGVMCDALRQENAYKNWPSYRYLDEGVDGWLFRTETDFQDDFTLKDEEIARLRALNDAFAAQGTTLILAILPTRGMMDGDKAANVAYDRQVAQKSYAAMVHALRDAGMIVAAIDNYDSQDAFYYKRDHHWRAAGARAMAHQVAAQVKALNISLPTKKFITEAQDEIAHIGTFEKLIKQTCGTDVAAQRIVSYMTYAPGDADALFADAQPADVVLLGTSNSANATSRANFDGFLKEALQADVDNRAISGGGADASMLSYLMARPAGETAPRVVVWEFPVYQAFSNRDFLRQAKAAVRGKCAVPVVQQAMPAGPFITPFANLAPVHMDGKEYDLHLALSPPMETDVRVVSVSGESASTSFTIRRDPDYKTGGRYAFDLETGAAPLSAIKLQFPDDVTGDVHVSLCERAVKP